MNSKNIKRIISTIILVMLLFPVKSFAVVNETSDFYVNDYAGVLTAETEKIIMDANIELQQKTGAQIVVVTVQSLEGKSIESYATELFRKFGIGDSKKNNGVLLLCSTGDREFRIEVGYGLEGTLTDGKTGRIQDEYIIPYLKNNNYDEGIKNGFIAILNEVEQEYGISVSSEEAVALHNNTTDSMDDIYVILIFFTMFSFFFGSAMSNTNKKIKVIAFVIYFFLISRFLTIMENAETNKKIIYYLIFLGSNALAFFLGGCLKFNNGSNYRGGTFSGRSYSSHSSSSYHGGGGRSGGGGSSRRF